MEESKAKQQANPAHTNHLATLQQVFSPYMSLVQLAKQRITPQHERDELGTLAVWYKTVGEMAMLAQDYPTGEGLLNDALRCFKKVQDFDCTSLIEGCEMLLQIAESNKPKGRGGGPQAAGRPGPSTAPERR